MAITARLAGAVQKFDAIRRPADAERASSAPRARRRPANAGREDRLVRAAIALAAMLIAGFAVLASGQLSAVSLMFLLLATYLSVTAATGRDALYGRFGIDTRDAGRVDLRPARHAVEIAGLPADGLTEDRDAIAGPGRVAARRGSGPAASGTSQEGATSSVPVPAGRLAS